MTTPDRSDDPDASNSGPWLKGPLQPLFVILLVAIVFVVAYMMIVG